MPEQPAGPVVPPTPTPVGGPPATTVAPATANPVALGLPPNEALPDEILTAEFGVTGLNRFGGRIDDEFLRELKGDRGRKTYREMSSNDPVVGGSLYAIKQLIRQVTWTMAPAKGPDVDDTLAAQVAEFFQGALMEDMSHTWQEALTEILSMLPYGWAYLEIVYKTRQGPTLDASTRSRFDDGLWGWRKWAIRGQETLYEWKMDGTGGVNGLWQQPPPGDSTRGILYIPIEKSLLFRTDAERNNPEGRSVLRTAYRPWYFKKRLEEIEGIGMERDLAGMPVLTAPEKLDIWSTTSATATALREAAERLVRNLKRDEQEGVLLPFGWKLELLSTAGRRQFDTTAVIERYDSRIAMSVAADFLLLGHQSVGSWALSSDKTDLFALTVGSFLDTICSTINRYAIPRLMMLNGWPLQVAPSLTHGDLESPDLDALGMFVLRMSQAGAVAFPNPELEKQILEAAGLHSSPELTDVTVGKRRGRGVRLSKGQRQFVDQMAALRGILGKMVGQLEAGQAQQKDVVKALTQGKRPVVKVRVDATRKPVTRTIERDASGQVVRERESITQ